ncbi:copper homeostasis protein CutC [Arthrobacter sp. 35W]|uniref:copper homeostasis protein CutC n=1 Tax=Arthrobacter sp. 35W TaxID=1132441 RepID=UPI000401E1E5|nr:copper homeostasis protein CutC [Arthrobacter sp. 35W]
METSTPRLALEIAVTSAAGAHTAQRVGADRVELCTALELGGVTPSQGLIAAAAESTGGTLPVHVLVRPRAGGFCYSDEELRTYTLELRSIAAQGVAGVVIGALDASGAINTAATTRLMAAAWEVDPGLCITFHRAIDQARDVDAAISDLIGLGVHRVLTSGQAATAHEGSAVLRHMVALADGRLEIMAGGGVRVEDIDLLAASVGVDAVHLSAKAVMAPAHRAVLPLGSADGGGHFGTDARLAAEAAAAVHTARRSLGAVV